MAEPQIRYDTTPTPMQVAAGIRQLIGYLGVAAGALGFSDASVYLGGLGIDPHAAGFIGIAATLVCFVWGQIQTRDTAKKLAVTGEAAPSNIALPK